MRAGPCVTDPSDMRLYVAARYRERFFNRLPWAVPLCAAIGPIHGVTAGRSGSALITYTLSAMATQAFIVAPLLTLILALIPSRRLATESERRTPG